MFFPVSLAVSQARQRQTLPTALDTRGIREALSKEMRQRAIFSAQTTHATYLETIKSTVLEMLEGKTDRATARLRLKRKLAALGYDPETGFNGDLTGLGAAGSIQDLSSDVRLNLILKTLYGTIHGTARRQRETEPDRLWIFPAWQLVRIEPRTTERTDHRERWLQSGGPDLEGGHLIAWKWADVWRQLGDSDRFDDGLDTEFAPYWFHSGYGIREVSRPRAESFLGRLAVLRGGPLDRGFKFRGSPFPPAKAPLEDLDAATLADLKKQLHAVEQGDSLTFEGEASGTLRDLETALDEQARTRLNYPEPEFD
jgi:hypothetical protein